MISEKQLESNRRNAQLSTGPRTQEGKDIVRANAITHGLRAEAFDVLPGENEAQFNAKLEAWNRDMHPSNEAEADLVRRAAILSWKLDRADRHESAILSQKVMEAVNACDCEDDDIPALQQAAAAASFDPSNEGERLRRYQSSTLRAFLRTVDTLLKMRRDAQKEQQQAIRANKAISAPTVAAVPAPNKPISQPMAAAPNKPISQPMAAAPNKPISTQNSRPSTPIGARELDQFLAETGPGDSLGAISSGFSFQTR